MPTLRIDLQEGFADDSIVVRVGDREVYRGEGVRTSLLLGIAHSVSAEVPRGRVPVEVDVPSRGVSGATTVDIDEAAYLGVSVSADGIAFQVSGGPFGYA